MITNNGLHGLMLDRDYTYIDTTGEERLLSTMTGSYNASSTNTASYAMSNYKNYSFYYLLTPYASTSNCSSYTDETTAASYNLTYTSSFSSSSSYYYCQPASFIFVGTGTTEAALTDYCLAENCTTLTGTYAECTVSDNVWNTARTFKNETDDDITITEMGLYFVRTGNSSSALTYVYSKFPPVLAARNVLSTPVTISSGETYTFTYILNTSNLSEA